MPYELFWHLNPKKIEPFKTAYQKRIEQENHNAWLQGGYIRDAIASCFDKESKYPQQPYSMEKSDDVGLSGEEQFLLWIDEYNRSCDSRNIR